MLKREYTLVKKEKRSCPSVQMQWFCLLHSELSAPSSGFVRNPPPLYISPPLPSPLFLILAKEYQAAFNCGGCLVGLMSSDAELGLWWTL